MEIKYQNYWASVKKIQSEVQLIGRLDISNKTKYKKKYEPGAMTAKGDILSGDKFLQVQNMEGISKDVLVHAQKRAVQIVDNVDDISKAIGF